MFAGELFCKLGDDFAKVVLRVTIAIAAIRVVVDGNGSRTSGLCATH